MKIKQIEHTPIGDYFHDQKLLPVFEDLTNLVDEFEVETDDLDFYVDYLVTHLKELKKIAKNIEKKTNTNEKINKLDIFD